MSDDVLSGAKSVLFYLVAALIQRAVSRELFGRIEDLAADAAVRLSASGTGAEKKAWLLERLEEDRSWVVREVKALPSWFLSVVVDIAVGRMKQGGVL